MMRAIIYTRPDGGVSIVHPVINTHPTREKITEAQAEERAWARLPVDAIAPQWVDRDALPSDRTFRDAWKAAPSGIEHDMDKCREIHREKLRRMRAPLLSALDVEYARADEAGDADAKKEIAGRKKALRDAPSHPAINAAQSPEELMLAVPECLK